MNACSWYLFALTGKMHMNTLASACTVITQVLTSTLVTYLQVSVAMKLTQCWEGEEEEEEEEEEEKEGVTLG